MGFSYNILLKTKVTNKRNTLIESIRLFEDITFISSSNQINIAETRNCRSVIY